MDKKQVPLNLVAISGMQGSGKDTLINDLLQAPEGVVGRLPFKLVHYKKCEMTTFTDIMERQIRRIAKHAIDWGRATKLALDNPDTIVLVDRCYCDASTYIDCFELLNWISQRERDYLHDLLDQAFDLWDVTQIKPFFLNPPLWFIRKNLKIRAEQGKAKWREDDDSYLSTLHTSYNFSLSVDDPWETIGYKWANEFEPGYECIENSRTSRVFLLRNYLLNRWLGHTKKPCVK